MAIRSGSRTLSFDLLTSESSGDDKAFLHRSASDPIHEHGNGSSPALPYNKQNQRRRRKKASKLKKQALLSPRIDEDPPVSLHEIGPESDDKYRIPNGFESDSNKSVVCNPPMISENGGGGDVETEIGVSEAADLRYLHAHSSAVSVVELRQRTVNGARSEVAETANDEKEMETSSSSGQRICEPNGNVAGKLETAKSLDWNRVMAEDSNYMLSVEKLPLNFFMGEIYGGNSLRSTTSVGNDIKRQRVYNTMFHVPWRCELLINVGFFVCLDSFLSLLTIMPARILMTFWRFLNVRQFQRPCAAELSDFGCFIVLASGVTLLQATDISLIYHIIRGQGTIKLYVVYNVLEIFDKLCQSFGGDVLQVLFNSAEGVASCAPENMAFELMRFILDQTIAVLAILLHSFILLAQAITLSTCIVAHNNALLALLVSNNFSEIKSNVFKRVSKENIHSLAYYDTVERFHITAFVLFVLAQNILEADGPWFGSFLNNALLVYVCEMLIDVIKHSFLAKFNEIKPVAYSEFLEDLCKQTLNIQSEEGRKSLTFVPLAPACVVIRVLTPIYAAHLPYGPLPWRLFWIFILSALTYAMLVILKIIVGMGLRLHATWYVSRCEKKRHHLHLD
ncbi:protein POLLEN DEFECTIVE IN GUIDANCE 1 [Cinnamomum micranthum f. kanehirae]|uniref:Protein POLLEN DEFECTIVE IN GUIDANCE 1 n=1 Tax=Cinnamomum micranthum f. kanehirae TaxID=337451 RepID=A0A3S3NNU5_9MAGN|nr:protein POLLEN DEFECTIVE IN GUIDANCE 1 [Cinnamomum micranthum f. kanehirae]